MVDVFMWCITWAVSGHPAHTWRLMVLMAVRETEYIIENKSISIQVCAGQLHNHVPVILFPSVSLLSQDGQAR
jgi:hypothetical protein